MDVNDPDILLALTIVKNTPFARPSRKEIDAAIAEIERLRTAVELATGMIGRSTRRRSHS